MGPDDTTASAEARTRLGALLATTVDRLAALQAEHRAVVDASRDSNADDEHDPEGSTIAFEQAQVDALARDAVSRLASIDAALARLDAGTCGTCAVCGQAIPAGRPEARPTATTCVACGVVGELRACGWHRLLRGCGRLGGYSSGFPPAEMFVVDSGHRVAVNVSGASLTTTSKVRREALAAPAQQCGEGFLLEHARTLPLPQLRDLARRWAAQADPDTDNRGYRDARDREFFNLAETTTGCHLSGFVTTEHGHALRAALDAMADRSATASRAAGHPARRRRAHALTTLVRTVLDRDLTGKTGDHRPHITCVVDLDTLTRALTRAPGGPGRYPTDAAAPAAGTEPVTHGHDAAAPFEGRPHPVGDVERFAVAELIGTGPIPDTVLARLACDSTIARVVFGPASQVLNVGRSERTYTGHKRRAIIARDTHCQAPHCNAPPAMSEIHHTQHWARDHGTTDTNTGVLLCWQHHEWVHDQGVSITTDPHGRWIFTDRNGHALPG